MTATERQPLVAFLYSVPLLHEALLSTLDSIADIQAFPAGRGDVTGLLRSVGPDAILVDDSSEADASARLGRATSRPASAHLVAGAEDQSAAQRRLGRDSRSRRRNDPERPRRVTLRAEERVMNATLSGSPFVKGVELYDEMTGAVDERTLAILDRRRRTATVHGRGWLVHRMLVLADLLGLVAAFLLVELLSAINVGAVDQVDRRAEFLIFALSLPAWIIVTKLYGLYDQDEERTDHSTADDVVGVFHMVTVCTWLFFAFAYLTRVAHPTAPKLLLFWAMAIGLVSLGRASARAYCRRRINYLQNAVIIGAGDVGQLVARKLLNHPEYGINLVGFLDANPKERREDMEDLTLLGPPERLPAVVRLAGHRAGNRCLLGRHPRADARPNPLDEGSRRAGRHCA